MRVAGIVEYDGARFSGWQRQDGVRSVQQCVEEALSQVANEPVRVVVAGRTDAGVHALAQVVHFDTVAQRSEHSWVRGTNSNLPPDISLLWAGGVSDTFHARYAATGRHYEYVILNRPVRPTTLRQRVSWYYQPLDVERMQAGARHLIGAHDFTSFRAAECQAKNPVRDVRAIEVTRHGEYVRIHAYANAFLHHMVRNIAGVLMQIGCGDREPDWAAQVLAARDRTRGGVTAAPDGLYLASIEYPAEFNLPSLARPGGLL